MPILVVNKHIGSGFISLLFQIANSRRTLNFGIIIVHKVNAVLFMNSRGLWLFFTNSFCVLGGGQHAILQRLGYLRMSVHEKVNLQKEN